VKYDKNAWFHKVTKFFLKKLFSDRPKKFSGQLHFKSSFFVKKNLPVNNITIAFVALFPILETLFSMLQHEDSDNIDNFPTGLNNRGAMGSLATVPLIICLASEH
jgi:hypothetical protein